MRALCWYGLLLIGLLPGVSGWAAERAESVFSHPVAGSEPRQSRLQALADSVRSQGEIRGRFVQYKHLSVLSRPIESEGRFVLDEQGRFRWDIQAPFPVAYRFDGEELTRVQKGQSNVVHAADDPSLYGFFAFISSLFQQTDGELEEHFERFYKESGEGWTLGLRPRNDRLRRALSQLVVTGQGGEIEQVVLTEPGGDYTRLQFFYPESEAVEDSGAVEMDPAVP
ncbi:outer membrane lipoprotein carrier protein LolA [Marinimicrobium sp. ARAG 43.8]|uniref:outer membrane lipoprotein carrier protein LolA n=1 Tax=Marinimicrobium sp. ARAG 43.8 TaxID=3418719 RepID=UPI003CF86D87